MTDAGGFKAAVGSAAGTLFGALMLFGLWCVWAVLPSFVHPSLFNRPDVTVQVPVEEAATWEFNAGLQSVRVPASYAAKCRTPFLLRPVVGSARNITIEVTQAGNIVASQTFSCSSLR